MTESKTMRSNEPTNKDRAEWAHQALEAFEAATGSEGDDAMCDLLADLMHYCRLNDISFGDELSRAERHFTEEVDEETELEKRQNNAAGPDADRAEEAAHRGE
jgi:hypothetical protein